MYGQIEHDRPSPARMKRHAINSALIVACVWFSTVIVALLQVIAGQPTLAANTLTLQAVAVPAVALFEVFAILQFYRRTNVVGVRVRFYLYALLVAVVWFGAPLRITA